MPQPVALAPAPDYSETTRALASRHPFTTATVHRVVRWAEGVEIRADRVLVFAAARRIDPSDIIDILNDFGVVPGGLRWGPFRVLQLACDAKGHTLAIGTPKKTVILHSSPTGKITPDFTSRAIIA